MSNPTRAVKACGFCSGVSLTVTVERNRIMLFFFSSLCTVFLKDLRNAADAGLSKCAFSFLGTVEIRITALWEIDRVDHQRW